MSQAFYISDNRNFGHPLRYIDASGIISSPTVTSTDSLFISNGGIAGPWGIAMSPDGTKLYIVDELSSPECVYSIDTTTYVATRIAGGGGAGALGWTFGDIYSVACDAQGNVYIGDTAGRVTCVNMQGTTQTILNVSIASGAIAAVAGSGVLGFSGDGGPATAAKLRNVYGLALDSAGNLFFCDQLNFRVRRVDAATGIITTVVGSGPVFPALTLCNAIASGDGGDPTLAVLNSPIGIALDPAGNIYIAQPCTASGNDVIRVVNTQATPQTLLGTVIAPNTIQTVTSPIAQTTNKLWFLDVDSLGNLAFCNAGGLAGVTLANVWEVTTAGAIVAIAGVGGNWGSQTGNGGPATSARLGEAFGIAFVPAPVPPPTGNIIVQKITTPTGSPQSFTFHPTYAEDFALTDGQSNDSGPIEPGTYSVTEDPVPQWSTSINVSTGDPPTAIVLDGGETITVTFANTQPCAPVDGITGDPVNGVFIPDLSLFIIPATSLYKDLVPFSAIRVNESHVEGRAAVILDFNDSEGIYSRDMGTIFTWPVFSETILDVWQPSIIPMDGEIYDRLSYHCLMTSLNSVGWNHAREMNLAYAAPAGLTILLQFDQWPDITLTLPASVSEIKAKLTLPPNKWKLVEIFISSPQAFKLWTNDLELKTKPWGSAEPYRVARPVSG